MCSNLLSRRAPQVWLRADSIGDLLAPLVLRETRRRRGPVPRADASRLVGAATPLALAIEGAGLVWAPISLADLVAEGVAELRISSPSARYVARSGDALWYSSWSSSNTPDGLSGLPAAAIDEIIALPAFALIGVSLEELRAMSFERFTGYGRVIEGRHFTASQRSSIDASAAFLESVDPGAGIEIVCADPAYRAFRFPPLDDSPTRLAITGAVDAGVVGVIQRGLPFVRPDCRCQGVGRALMLTALADAPFLYLRPSGFSEAGMGLRKSVYRTLSGPGPVAARTAVALPQASRLAAVSPQG